MATINHLLRIARDVKPTTTDGELLQRYVQNQDEAAFAEVVHRNGPLVLSACRSILGDVTAAEDAFQATFLLLAGRARQLTRPGSLAGWLHATAVRIARTARRTEIRARRREFARISQGPISPDDLTWRDLREILDSELATLPEKYRVPLVLCYLQELSYQEAALLSGCSVGSLRGRLERGKERLRQRLAKYGLPLTVPVLVLGPPTPVSAALTEATFSTVRTMATGGTVPLAIARLVHLKTSLRVAFFAPFTLAIAAVGVVLAVAGQPVASPSAVDQPQLPILEAKDEPAPRLDRFGDPLPDGVLMRLGTIRSRAPIAGFGITSDGTVISVSPSAEVFVWPPKSEQPSETTQLMAPGLKPINPHATISPDGRYIAADTAEKKVVIKERKGNEFKEIASFDINQARNLRFSPDGARLAVTAEAIYICDIGSGKMQKLDGFQGYCGACSFSGDGTKLAVVKDYEAVLWDLKSGQRLAQYKTGRIRYTGIALDHTGSVLAVSPTWEPYTVVFVNPTTGERIARLSSPEKVRALWACFAPDGKTVLIGDWTGITWWDPEAGKTLRRFEGMAHSWAGGWNVPARFSPDGQVLVGTSGHMLLRWDAATGKPILPHLHDAGHQSNLSALGITPNGKWIATGGNDAQIYVWDAITGRSVATFATDSLLGLRNVELSSDGKFVFGPSQDKEGITKWEVASGRPVLQLGYSDSIPRRGSLRAYWLSPDARTISALSGPLVASDPIIASSWDTASGKILSDKPTDLRLTEMGSFQFSPDGRWLTTGSSLYPIEVGRVGKTLLKDGFSMFDGGTFSADSRLLAKIVPQQVKTGVKWIATVFEVATGAKVAEIPLEWVYGVAFHPDSRSLVVAASKTLTFHDLTTGKPFAVRKAPDPNPDGGNQTVVRYFPDGTKLITGHADTTALIWEAPPRPKSTKDLGEKGRIAAWNNLNSLDGAKGWAAVWALADDAAATAFLRDKVKPVAAIPAKDFEQLLADLGSEDFATREAATERLGKAGESGAGQLVAALKTELSAEQKARVERLVAGWEGADSRPATGERLRILRAVAALELAGTTEARKLLAELAAGAVNAITTCEAKRALERYDQRQANR